MSEVKSPKLPHVPRNMFLVGSALLMLAIFASALLSAKHIWSLSLPGCGEGGGCEWAITGPWSAVFGYPVAFLGLAIFCGLLAVWLITGRRGVWPPLLLATRLGVVGSVTFLTVMIAAGHICPWCLAAHIGNLGWWLCIEWTSGRVLRYRDSATLAIVAGTALFILLGGSLKLAEAYQRKTAAETSSKAAAESIAKIGQSAPEVPNDTPSHAAPQPEARPTPSRPGSSRFGGRYWTGDPNAPVRIVVFQDYRCELCREAESTLTRLLATRSDVTLSVKQWPFDKECNKMILGESMHPGSCLDARSAEAVGLIGGKEQFWKFHTWLFQRGGAVSITDIRNQVSTLGLDLGQFEKTLQTPVVDSLISADIADGVKYGIKFTPMIFVNGYELKGWQSPGAIPAMIEKAAQFARQKPRTDDLPDPAINQQFQDWLNSPPYSIAISGDDHIRGPLSAPTSIMMYGDVTEAFNADAFKTLARIITDTMSVLFIFRTFPLQAECNDMVKRPIQPRACEAARLLEAAALVGGAPAFWRVQNWIISHSDSLPVNLTDQVAENCNLDKTALTRAITDPKVDARIGQSIESAKQLGVDTSPSIFINGRRARDWRSPGLLKKILATTAAAQLYKEPSK